ncbi:indole-3-glycerol phosphate synthase TrpC [Gorillibacterium massiliense]|uniref:indole-3-glycerol phosphate synthase TrpC n=1 Tax=Gorillibacterium massiliense TaxID=1280390 RepID=UPI0004BB149B|nr:indole-3-glycerol phosphate synthase TrpC [Gorillibacterium massiliense]
MYLDKIVAEKMKEVEVLRSGFSLGTVEKEISNLPQCLGFAGSLIAGRKRDIGLIAEVKKASPSKGLIRPDFDPVAIAAAYESAGADCLSVLTDRTFFQGSGDYLRAVRQQVRVPLLRKDFVIDYRQIYEARIWGADAVLLIAAILTPQQMNEFLQISADLGLDALVEVHDQEELAAVLDLSAEPALIGVNNRNLRTFATDLQTTEKLAKQLPAGIALVSESGIAGPTDIDYLKSVGADAVLVGEYFMRQPDVAEAVHTLLGPIGYGKEITR